ncbi:uncharacterized protein LOC111028371 isoform X1 [Myzus persicae]|uniref:uncharacterized protein LOC111028371 isoform X1 n=1 Tax=Myzus persicae TaxID=13164 RepID=UPI000B930F47|nr:uncharacterized protein LOC111028371 isoform X1 [Myzus persicae]XP_022162685.1 uncharacterized protein LOC111028371 isoform X1 [Myzus persicae]XP_022162686.1 uncharacterized protein LOC111028371 isoform X1 [Myzus persicae]XP_022162687.1 uncharacterized protein LOC111028371 isoform X1 [Myzus persicae]XP_022162688.1 uncharacterized protein LOC111028371 isoform X1 [Myzus persicae]
MDNFRQRLCFYSPTVTDISLDHERNNEVQDVMVFFGADKIGNMIILCVNQNYKLKQSNSLILIRDPTGLELTNQETDKGSYEFSSWKTPSLQFQCTVPMRTWRIVFSGRLRKGENYHHLKINILWKAFGFPVYCDKNNTFFKHEIDHTDPDYINNLLGFDQFGQISGSMVVDGKTEMINMRAMRLRRWNMSVDDLAFVGFMDSDIVCSVQKLERINCHGHLKTTSEHEIFTPDDIHFVSEENLENDSLTIEIHHKNFSLNSSLKSQMTVVLNTVSIEIVLGDDFKGILLCFKDVHKTSKMVKCAEDISVNDHKIGLTVNLDSEMCMFSNIVGNKAKSLFQLKKAIVDGLIKDIIVPDGICITTVAMRAHINENKELSIDLDSAIEKAKHSDFEHLADYCERLNDRWRSTKLCTELMEAISNGVSEHCVYAVRSSGTFEDGESTSSAGQYITMLGCTGRTCDIAAAVLECWSSNFSARALTYRKNNGQPLMCDMAVIIQDQVSGPGVAGVAFSRDPNTGDPGKITVAASYGLEKAGVVSGSVEPHEVVVSRLRFEAVDENFTNSAGLMQATSNFSVENDGDAKPLQCISDNLAKKLADICVQVEGVFGSPQDIEWAAVEDRVYLLQSRPITSIFAWSNDEITHEFDTPFTSDDVIMFYNVKEVYPNPMHTLSLTLDFFPMYPLFKLTEGEPTEIYRNKQLSYTHNNMCLNVCQMFQDLEPGSVYVKIIEYSIAGKCFLTSEIWEKILLKNRSSALKKILKSISTFKETLYLESRINETHKLICSVNIEQSDTALDLLNNINSVVDVLEKVTFCHVASSTNNIISHTLLAILGLDFNKDSPIDTLSDLAASIDTPDIINVSILKDIQTIAAIVSEMSSKKEFCDLPVENCNDWLKLNCEKGYAQVEDFIKKYGHRGVQELDFGSETWSTDRNRLFSCLQSLILYEHRQSDKKPTDINSSTVSRGYIKKIIFDYLLKKYRQSISYREQSKDMLVQITHKLRLGYRKLGDKLVAEGRIPDSKLIFFMSQYEVRKMCGSNNCPEIVHKATKRRKLWPDWILLQFDDVCYGPPVPRTFLDEESVNSSTRFKGCSVFPGRVKNRACVLEHIEDARCLRTGDILIVKSVDIAWSPYFPIISGLITEIGGVISHGAVVAREYGLPCLVGVQNVKKYFKTGDMVILDSEKGFVSKGDSIITN